jgi:hypothetical protein
MKSAVARVVAESDSEQERAGASDEFAGLGENLGAVRREAIVARESTQTPVDFTRLIDQSLKTGPDRLCHTQCFISAGAEHRQERCHHEHQQEQERGERGERLAVAKAAEDPLIGRIAQTGKNCRQ